MYILKDINEENYKELYQYIEENKYNNDIEILVQSVWWSTNHAILIAELLNKYKDQIILKILFCFSAWFNVCYLFQWRKELIWSTHAMVHLPRIEANVALIHGDVKVLPNEYEETLYSLQNLKIDVDFLPLHKRSQYHNWENIYLSKKELEYIFYEYRTFTE